MVHVNCHHYRIFIYTCHRLMAWEPFSGAMSSSGHAIVGHSISWMLIVWFRCIIILFVTEIYYASLSGTNHFIVIHCQPFSNR